MSWHSVAPLIVVALFITACAAGKQSDDLSADADPLELARQGLGPFPQERVRIGIQQRVDDLRQSGPDDRGLEAHSATLTEEWKAVAARLGEDVRFSDWECFASGCAMVSRHAPASLTHTLAEFSHSEAFLRWNAGKFQSAPQQSGQGLLEVTWILFAPRRDVPIMSPDQRFSGFGAGPREPEPAQKDQR